MISRQRNWQLRKARLGLCIQCGRPKEDRKGLKCEDCAERQLRAQRRAKDNSEWHRGGRGRPPLNREED